MGNSPSKPGGSSERFILENPEFSRQNEPTIDVKISSDLLSSMLQKEEDQLKRKAEKPESKSFIDPMQDFAVELDRAPDETPPGLHGQHLDPASLDLSVPQNYLEAMIEERVQERFNAYKDALDQSQALNNSSKSSKGDHVDSLSSNEMNFRADTLLRNYSAALPSMRGKKECENIQSELQQCLSMNPRTSLNCRSLVSEFERCVYSFLKESS